jgi:AraC family transcriptional regulator
MKVEIVNFPETKVAVLEHWGPPALEHQTARKLISWRIENGLLPSSTNRSYGVHYGDPNTTPPSEHHVDFCISVDHQIAANSFGVINKVIPALRCAKTRHFGSREDVIVARYLYEEWLPKSGERLGAFPVIFHYVNVGPNVKECEMITDVYLPLVRE